MRVQRNHESPEHVTAGLTRCPASNTEVYRHLPLSTVPVKVGWEPE